MLALAVSAQAAERQRLHDHVPAAVAYSPSIGRLESTNQLDLVIGLPLRNQDALNQQLQEIYDPASANYHHYVTPAQFTERFGPTEQDYQSVIEFARTNGLEITGTHPNRTLLDVKASVADIERICHVTMRLYQHPTEARAFFAPDVEPSLDLDVPLASIGGLDNFIIPHPMNLKAAHSNKATRTAPQANGSGPSGNYIGNDFRAAYVPGVTLNGAGQSVGLLEFDGYYSSDITAYENLAGLPNVTVTNVLIDRYKGTAGSADDEVSLDIEMAISMAPGLASVIVYETSTRNPGNDLLNRMATDNVAKQLSSSWTFSINSSTTSIFQQFAMQGQTYFNASGDSGEYPAGSIPSPADSTNITIVGGTTLTTSGPGGSYVSETVWSWFPSQSYASSGGVSSQYLLPVWQQGISMAINQGSTVYRNIPDVALTANNIWVIYNNGSSAEYGGTSCAAPLWAAFTALVNQQAVSYGTPTVGFINPAIYSICKGPNYASAFHDITTGNNTNSSSSTNYFATAGYDLCTGWGTPSGANLINLLAPPASPVISAQPHSTNVVAGTGATFSVTAVGAAPLSYQWQLNSTNLSDNGHITGSQTNALNIANTQLTDAGNYRVIITNSSGSITSSAAALGVYVAPVITNQPQSLSVPQGSNAVFTVGASGTTPLYYQWQFNSNNLADNGHILGSQTSSLTVNNLQLSDAGNYQVIITNSVGSITSALAALTVYLPPSITNQPQSQTVLVGSNATFSVSASGSVPLSYQWRFNGTNIALATNTSYTISNAQTNNQGNYSVVVTNGGGSVISSNAVLIVGVPPTISLQPTNKTVNQGSATFFSVTAAGSPTLYYQWLMNGSNIAGATGSTCAISSAQPNQAGNYQAIITNNYGSVTSSVATLTVLSVPSITGQPQSQSVMMGSNTTFSVTASGGNLSYQWLFNTAALSGATASTYIVTNAQTNNAGNYSVIVTNTLGSVTSSNALLTVNLPQPPQFLSVSMLSNGPVQMVLSGQIGSTYAIDGSSDLVNWTQLVTFLNSNGTYQFTDTSSTNHAQGFYRARLVQ